MPAGAHTPSVRGKSPGIESATGAGSIFIRPVASGGGGTGGDKNLPDNVFPWHEPQGGDCGSPARRAPEGEAGSGDIFTFAKPSASDGNTANSTSGRSVEPACFRRGHARFAFDLSVNGPRELSVGEAARMTIQSGTLTANGARIGQPGGGPTASTITIGDGDAIIRCKDFVPRQRIVFRVLKEPGGTFDFSSLPGDKTAIILDKNGKRILVNSTTSGPNFFEVTAGAN